MSEAETQKAFGKILPIIGFDPKTGKNRVADLIAASTSGTAYNSQPFSVAAAFGGYCPRKWGVVVRNFSGVALSSVANDHVISYTEIYSTVAP
jgi:hypothetical protein